MARAIGAAVVGGPVDARPWAGLSRYSFVAAESWPSACQLHSSGWKRLSVSEPLHVGLDCSQASAVGAAVVVGPFVSLRGWSRHPSSFVAASSWSSDAVLRSTVARAPLCCDPRESEADVSAFGG